MAETRARIAELDPVWDRITREAEQAVADAPDMEKIIEGFTVSVPGAAPATR